MAVTSIKRKKPTVPVPSKEASIVAVFRQKKETKGAFQFEEIDENGKVLDMADAKIGSLYIRKSAIGDASPSRLTVTVEYE